MSYRKHHGSREDCTTCPYCGRRDYYPAETSSCGRCSCGGRRGFDLTVDPEGDTVSCFTCGKVSERLTAQHRDNRERRKYALETMAEHIRTTHRSREILKELAEVERSARYAMRHGQLTDADWRDHELAKQYRALMIEWWALPKVTADDLHHSPTRDRFLTQKGDANSGGTDWLVMGRKKLLKHATETGERRFSVGDTQYRLWFDEPETRAV